MSAERGKADGVRVFVSSRHYPGHGPRGTCLERGVAGGWRHQGEREAHPQPSKELEGGWNKECATSPPLDGVGGVSFEDADVPIPASVDPATGRTPRDALLHQA